MRKTYRKEENKRRSKGDKIVLKGGPGCRQTDLSEGRKGRAGGTERGEVEMDTEGEEGRGGK